MRFSLKWLLWLVVCCAVACWLLTLPAIFIELKSSLTTDSDGTITATVEYAAAHWPLEVVARIAVCAALFVLPAAFARWARR